VSFEYGTTNSYGSTVSGGTVSAGSGSSSVSGALSNLTCNTTYYYRVTATNYAGTTNGSGRSFVTSGCPQSTLTVIAPSSLTFGNTATLSFGGGSGGGAVSYSAGSSTGCSVSGTTLSVTNASGTCAVTATKAADSTYAEATSVAVPVTLNKATQTINFGAAPNVAVGSTGTVTTTGGGSNIARVYASTTQTACTVDSSTGVVTGLTGGTNNCTITANQAGDSNYSAATQVQQSFSVNSVRAFTGPAPAGGAQSVSFTTADAGCTFDTSATTFQDAAPATLDSGYSRVGGINTLKIVGCSTSTPATINFTITYPNIPAGAVYRKFGPTPTSNGASLWYTFGTVSGNTVSFSITDGQLGDDDVSANGVILDPGALSSATAGIPTLSEWSLIILSALLALGTFGVMRRRQI